MIEVAMKKPRAHGKQLRSVDATQQLDPLMMETEVESENQLGST